MVMFKLGTTIIFGYGSSAGRDAWISSAISALLGGALIACFAAIAKLNKFTPLVEWFKSCFGIWLGTILAWLYPLFFIYTAERVICDIRFLLPLAII
jgi:spore germination protein KB